MDVAALVRRARPVSAEDARLSSADARDASSLLDRVALSEIDFKPAFNALKREDASARAVAVVPDNDANPLSVLLVRLPRARRIVE